MNSVLNTLKLNFPPANSNVYRKESSTERHRDDESAVQEIPARFLYRSWDMEL